MLWRGGAWVAGGLITLGILLRLVQYLLNRSLWIDEANLAVHLLSRWYGGLLEPLDFELAVPTGFLILVRAAIDAFGPSEYALRLVPVISGILSLFLFHQVARRTVRPPADVIALALFALSTPLIYYSSELKQYSTDVAVALLVTLAGLEVASAAPDRLRWSHGAVLGVVGAVAIWLSHPAVFVVAGTGSVLGILCLRKRSGPSLAAFGVAAGIWLASLAILYQVSLRHAVANETLVEWWSDNRGFLPLAAAPLEEAAWLLRLLWRFFVVPFGMPLAYLAAPVALLGIFSLFSSRRLSLLWLASPLPFALIASALQKYPLKGRLLLFLVPAIVLFVAEGLRRLVQSANSRSVLLGRGLLIAFLVPAAWPATYSLALLEPIRANRSELEDMKPVLDEVSERRQRDDLLYVYYGAAPGFRYHGPRSGLSDMPVVYGVRSREDPSRYLQDVQALRGRARVWFLFSHYHADEPELYLDNLDAIGRRISGFRKRGSAAYLYDLQDSQSGQAVRTGLTLRGRADEKRSTR